MISLQSILKNLKRFMDIGNFFFLVGSWKFILLSFWRNFVSYCYFWQVTRMTLVSAFYFAIFMIAVYSFWSNMSFHYCYYYYGKESLIWKTFILYDHKMGISERLLIHLWLNPWKNCVSLYDLFDNIYDPMKPLL